MTAAPTPAAVQALADRVDRPDVRELFIRLATEIYRLHRDIDVTISDVDVRAACDVPLCRLVPYRELIHVQVGDEPAWESRVRDEAGYYEALDMIVRSLLRVFSGRSPLS